MLKVRVKIWKTYEGFAVERRKPRHAVLRSSALPRLGGDGERGSGWDAELGHGCWATPGSTEINRNKKNAKNPPKTSKVPLGGAQSRGYRRLREETPELTDSGEITSLANSPRTELVKLLLLLSLLPE